MSGSGNKHVGSLEILGVVLARYFGASVQYRDVATPRLSSLVIHVVITCAMPHLVPEDSSGADHFIKDVLAHVCVHGAQRIIEQVHVSIEVHRSRQAHALLLAAAQVDALGKSRQKELGTHSWRTSGATGNRGTWPATSLLT